MFWRRRKTPTAQSVFKVNHFAAQLGIERRRHIRVRYPSQNLTSLPIFFFGGRGLRLFDISAGGVCILDPDDTLGPDAGNTFEMRMVWPDCERVVTCRMVSRVHDRRHVQFMDLENERQEAINRAILPGVSALSMKPILQSAKREVELQALEAWTSIQGDTLTFFNDVHLLAEANLDGAIYRFFKMAWPMTSANKPASPREVEQILLFLTNIPQPSPAVTALLEHIQAVYFEGRR